MYLLARLGDAMVSGKPPYITQGEASSDGILMVPLWSRLILIRCYYYVRGSSAEAVGRIPRDKLGTIGAESITPSLSGFAILLVGQTMISTSAV